MNTLREIFPSQGRSHVTRSEREVSHALVTTARFFSWQFRRLGQASDVAHTKLKNSQMKEDEKSSIMHVLSEDTGEVKRRCRNGGRMETSVML